MTDLHTTPPTLAPHTVAVLAEQLRSRHSLQNAWACRKLRALARQGFDIRPGLAAVGEAAARLPPRTVLQTLQTVAACGHALGPLQRVVLGHLHADDPDLRLQAALVICSALVRGPHDASIAEQLSSYTACARADDRAWTHVASAWWARAGNWRALEGLLRAEPPARVQWALAPLFSRDVAALVQRLQELALDMRHEPLATCSAQLLCHYSQKVGRWRLFRWVLTEPHPYVVDSVAGMRVEAAGVPADDACLVEVLDRVRGFKTARLDFLGLLAGLGARLAPCRRLEARLEALPAAAFRCPAEAERAIARIRAKMFLGRGEHRGFWDLVQAGARTAEGALAGAAELVWECPLPAATVRGLQGLLRTPHESAEDACGALVVQALRDRAPRRFERSLRRANELGVAADILFLLCDEHRGLDFAPHLPALAALLGDEILGPLAEGLLFSHASRSHSAALAVQHAVRELSEPTGPAVRRLLGYDAERRVPILGIEAWPAYAASCREASWAAAARRATANAAAQPPAGSFPWEE